MQLSQLGKSPSVSSPAGFARQPSMTARATAGLTTAAVASQSVQVLQLEVQRLASDRTVLMKKMQVCISLLP